MARYTYIVLTRAVAGRDEEFHHWYDNQHLADCVALPEITSARRLRVLTGIDAATQPGEPAFHSVALYEIESDAPVAVAQALSRMAGSAAMPMTEAFDRSGSMRMVAAAAGSAES